jgi:hypothetical protein
LSVTVTVSLTAGAASAAGFAFSLMSEGSLQSGSVAIGERR